MNDTKKRNAYPSGFSFGSTILTACRSMLVEESDLGGCLSSGPHLDIYALLQDEAASSTKIAGKAEFVKTASASGQTRSADRRCPFSDRLR